MNPRRKSGLALALLVVTSSCQTGTTPDPAESPRPTASLRGGVRGELGEAESSNQQRRDLEHNLLDEP